MGNDIKTKHNFNDGLFRHLFKEEKNFSQMYEVFTGVKLSPDEVEFKDTDSIILSKDLKNDISFVTKDGRFIFLVEHQSTKSPNIGLRMLIYYAELLKIHIKKHDLNIYGSVPVDYPKAELYVAYNGKQPWLENDEIIAGDVKLKIRLIDINFDKLPIKDAGNVLSGYAYLVQQFEYYKKDEQFSSQMAVDKALTDCRESGYLLDYVKKEEFLSMVTKRWTVEQQKLDYGKWERAEGREEKALEIAKSLLKSGMSSEKVAVHTGISVQELQELTK